MISGAAAPQADKQPLPPQRPLMSRHDVTLRDTARRVRAARSRRGSSPSRPRCAASHTRGSFSALIGSLNCQSEREAGRWARLVQSRGGPQRLQRVAGAGLGGGTGGAGTDRGTGVSEGPGAGREPGRLRGRVSGGLVTAGGRVASERARDLRPGIGEGPGVVGQ